MEEPPTKGFGSRIIENLLANHSAAQKTYAPTGLVCRLTTAAENFDSQGKQGLGSAVGSDKLESEGAAQERKGDAQKAVGDAKNATKDAVNKTADAVNKNSE